MINCLESMKLTADEEETITISDEGRRMEIESCTMSLIGKFLTCKPFNKKAAKNTLQKAWGLEDKVQIVEVGPNLFQFKFNTEFDMEQILKGGPWSFDNQLLMLTRWKKGMRAENVQLQHAALWVQIWGAPFDMVLARVAKEVGGRLGEVVEVKNRRKQEDPSYFMRVKVAIPISKPLRRDGFLAGSDGERSWVTFKYERLPMFCHYCGLLGHNLRHCASHFSATKSGVEVNYQYGDWFKAIGVCSISPTKRYAEKSSNIGDSHGVKQQGHSSSSAVEKVPNKNPRETGRRVEGETQISGDITDFSLQNSKINAVVESNKEGNAIVELNKEMIQRVNGGLNTDKKVTKGRIKEHGTDGYIASIMHATISEEPLDMDYMDYGMHDGPEVPKPKSTSVRLRRELHGPSEKGSEQYMSMLRKRGAKELENKDNHTGCEAQSGKRGKVEVDDKDEE